MKAGSRRAYSISMTRQLMNRPLSRSIGARLLSSGDAFSQHHNVLLGSRARSIESQFSSSTSSSLSRSLPSSSSKKTENVLSTIPDRSPPSTSAHELAVDSRNNSGLNDPQSLSSPALTYPMAEETMLNNLDYRSSIYSPVSSVPMADGSSPSVKSLPAATLSGAPPDLQTRTVRIFQPTPVPTQSGTRQSSHWLVTWDPLAKGHRWENPMTGWQSTSDQMQGESSLRFRTCNQAIRFAAEQGYKYYVQQPNKRKIVPKAYVEQFLHVSGTLKQVRTK